MKKTNILNSIKIIALAIILAVGVSYVIAAEPTTNPSTTNTEVAAPIHTGPTVQEKKGSIWSKNVLASPISIFRKSIFLPGKTSALRIGSDDSAAGSQSFTKGSAGAITQDLNTALFGETDTIPLVIDLQDRANAQDGIEFITDQACPIVTRFTNDKAAAFEFKKGTDRANIIARQVRLTGGDPDAKDVLVGDANGNARWAKASVVDGVVVFSSGVSPVIEGQTCVVPPVEPVVDVCTNITGNQTTIPPGYHAEPAGSTNCVVDVDDDIEPWTLGCFIQDTKVTMADGTKKDIENIKVGDKLKAVNGVNTVQKLLRPKLNDQDVYSINGSGAFFTANHPFLTTNGWKSLDPKKTHVEIPTLTVTLMTVGDTLVTESGPIKIRSIASVEKSADTQLYNFELDGDHTYYANGYVVHNKIAVSSQDPNPTCDLNPSTPLFDCSTLNHYYCKVAAGNTQGACIPTVSCGTDLDCRNGPTLGTPPDQIQLVNGRCLVPTTTIHPADAGDSFCKW